jgi:hypothetical protein
MPSHASGCTGGIADVLPSIDPMDVLNRYAIRGSELSERNLGRGIFSLRIIW